MPLRILAPLALLLLALALAISACGDDDDGGSSPTPSIDASASPTESGGSESPGADEKTPADEGTESPGDTTEPSAPPSATPGAGGTAAVAPADQAGFLDQFRDATIDYADCAFNPATLIAACAVNGDFSVDPPLTGQDVACQVGLVEDRAVFVRCTSQVPLTTIYYEIQG